MAVVTAFALSTEQEAKFVKSLSVKLDKKSVFPPALIKTLIGGVIIRAGDLVIDASVKGKLAKLAEAIGS